MMLNRPKRDVYALPSYTYCKQHPYHFPLLSSPPPHCRCLPASKWWINAAQQLRLIFAELGAPSISSSFTIPRVHKTFDEDGRLMDEAYDKRVLKFLEEYEWYIEAFKNQRNKGTPY